MEFITGKVLSRRTVVKGVGATLALPFLDAMVPARLTAFARPAPVAPHRFLAYYLPNGQAMPHWTPTGEGKDFELSMIMEPLAPFNGTSDAMGRLGRFFREQGLYTFVRWHTFFTNPPLTITEDELRHGFDIIDRGLKEISA